MTRTGRIAAWVLAALVAATTPLAARAATCTASATGVAFGNYDPTAATATTSTGQVTVSCNRGFFQFVNYSIALSAGSGSFAGRTLIFGASTLSYQLYTDATYSTVWGDGSGGSATISDSYLLVFGNTIVRNYSVYGRIPADQWPPAGVYSDLIVVTVTY